MVNQRELTEDGLERNFATNTLGVCIPKNPFLIINYLLYREVVSCIHFDFPSVTI